MLKKLIHIEYYLIEWLKSWSLWYLHNSTSIALVIVNCAKVNVLMTKMMIILMNLETYLNNVLTMTIKFIVFL